INTGFRFVLPFLNKLHLDNQILMNYSFDILPQVFITFYNIKKETSLNRLRKSLLVPNLIKLTLVASQLAPEARPTRMLLPESFFLIAPSVLFNHILNNLSSCFHSQMFNFKENSIIICIIT